MPCSSYQAQKIKEIYPEIPDQALIEIDADLKGFITSHGDSLLEKDAETFIAKRIVDYISDDECGDVLQTNCENIAKLYIKNDLTIRLQEGWFCIFAYFITLVLMIVDSIDFFTGYSDIIAAVLFFVTLVIWVLIQKVRFFMTEKKMLLLDSFNRVVPSMTIITGLIYFSVSFVLNSKALLWVIVAISVLITSLCSFSLYRKAKKMVSEHIKK